MVGQAHVQLLLRLVLCSLDPEVSCQVTTNRIEQVQAEASA